MVYIYRKYFVWFMIRENRVYGLYIQQIFCMVYRQRKYIVWFIDRENKVYGLQLEKNT